MKHLLIVNVFALLTILGLMGACTDNRVYEKNYDLPKSNWYIDSSLVFTFDVKDAEKRYNLKYNLRNTLSYPYYNMYVMYYLENDKGEQISSELQNITLMDAKTGEPFGSGLGDIFTHQLPIPNLSNYKFPKAGRYVFRLKQYMRRDPLPEVVSVGLRVEFDKE